MLKRFFKTAWRHAIKNPSITIIQIVGLTVGITVFLFISMWINNQLSYDRFLDNHEQIYRLEYSADIIGSGFTKSPLSWGPSIFNNIAGIEDFARLNDERVNIEIKYLEEGENEKKVETTDWIDADTSFFRIFSFDFTHGDPYSALDQPGSAVITKSLSDRLFGHKNPIGKTVNIEGDNYSISGVIKDVNNFHYPLELIRSINRWKPIFRENVWKWDSWEGWRLATYLLLNQNSDPEFVAEQISNHVSEIYSALNNKEENVVINLRPIKNIYFHGDTEKDRTQAIHGNLTLIIGLSVIALLILFLAILNFINLNTSRTFMRSKEVGVRKMTGASRESIFSQFTGEVVVICCFCLLLSIALIELLLPYFNNLISTNLKFPELFNRYNLITIMGSILIIIIIAGALPSISLASSKPARVLTSFNLGRSSRGYSIRKLLLILQYSITIIVIASTILVQKQTQFMLNSDTGFDISNLQYFSLNGKWDKSQEILLQDRMLQHPDILMAAYSKAKPPNIIPSGGTYSYNGKEIQMQHANIGPGFFDVLGIPVIAGRSFSYDIPMDDPDHKDRIYPTHLRRVILNETAVKELGMDNPVGSNIYWGPTILVEVIGVVKDFHFTTIKNEMLPIAFYYSSSSPYLLFKTTSENRQGVHQFIKSLCSEISGQDYVRFSNLEDDYYKDYQFEEQLGKLFIWFALISILIGALGLYGISTNAIQRRIKEIGIRKAHGATAGSILGMLQLYFSKIVLISGLIATPVSYYLLTKWLNGYPYKTDLSWWIFFGSLVFAVVIALATISYRTWKAARSNPVEALRYE